MNQRKLIELPRLTCLRCGYAGKDGLGWVPKIPDPAQCPKCHSPRWDQPKKLAQKL